GAVVALDAATGRRAWAVRYPQRESPLAAGTAGPHDPAPAVYAGGRLYVSPADADHVLCLDAATGVPLWASDTLDVAHLLGVTSGRVVCALGGFHAGLCALDAATGRRLPDWGYRVAGADALAPFGRGLLCGDRVYWPTRAAGLKELRWDGTTGYAPTAFRDLPGGNLAYGDGCLVVATADHLHVLVAPAAEAAGPGQPVGRRHDLLLWRADMLRRTGRPAAEVRAAFAAAAAPEFPPERRFLALVRRAEYERAAGRTDAASAAVRAVAETTDLSRVRLRDADGMIRSARAWVDEADTATAASGLATTSPPQVASGSSDRLRLPLRQTWRVTLDPGREWALLPDNGADTGRVYVAGRGRLACRDVADGAERWRRELPFTPTWLAAANGSLIAAGDNGVARLSTSDGRPAWQFRLPPAAPWFDRPGWRDPEAVAPAERLSGFRWAGGRVIARLGVRSLLAFDGDTGIVLWQHTAPLAGSFRPAYFADGECVAVQSADGRRWVFDAATGQLLHTGPAPADFWLTPPLALDDRRLLFVEDGRLVALDRATWEPAWTWELPRWPSLTGEPPQTRLADGVLLVGVARNDCYEVERLDPATGRPVASSVAVGRERVDLAAMALDDDMLYVADGGELRTIDCRHDQVVRRQKLEPAARWRVELADGGLLLWSAPVVSPFEPPVPGRVSIIDLSEPERQRGDASLALGPTAGLRDVRIHGNQVTIVAAGEVRGYRGAKREVK
ncbi:MAG TPA: PQQ-binding-like beta-propeller repeat protein, partial [Gemmataceae bacterium]